MSRRRLALVVSSLIFAAVCVPLLQMLLPAYPRYGKGGVGLISKAVYVHTKTKKNEALELATHRTLFTGDGETPQLKFLAPKGTSAPVLLLFTQNAIYFYDFSSFRGGNYLRGEDA
jgi:hypothetical protein